MKGDYVTGQRLSISYICTALQYKPTFIDQRVPGSIPDRGMQIFCTSSAIVEAKFL